MRAPADHLSETKTPYAVDCVGLMKGDSCGKVFLTNKGYKHQMMYAHIRWKCPICGGDAVFDDDNLEEFENV